MRAKVHIINSMTAWTVLDLNSGSVPSFISSYFGPGAEYLPYFATLFLNFQALIWGSLLPDKLDELVYDKEGAELWCQQRRKWTHAWSICIPITIFSWIVFGNFFITTFCVAYSLHCIVDVFTVTGVPILDPVKLVNFMPVLEETYQERRFELISMIALVLACLFSWGAIGTFSHFAL